MNKLTIKQQLFCQYFVSGADTCGNGVKAYGEAYGYDLADSSKYKSAKSNANRLLKEPKIANYIEELLAEEKLSRSMVDVQLDFLIRQNADMSIKLKAINTFYRFRMDEVEDKRGEMLSKHAATLLRPYWDADEWEEKYGHYYTESELVEIRKEQVYD